MLKRVLIAAAIILCTATTMWAQEHLCRNKKGDINERETCKADEVIADVREADDQMVKGCEYIGDVTASSGFGGLAQGLGQSRARKGAFKRAAQKGATHIVWSRQASGWGGGNSSGRTYKCDPNLPTAPETIKAVVQPEGEATAVQTKTVSLGQTTQEVEETLGKPEKIINLGSKVTYVYKDLKVIFIDGKVADVQ